MTETETMNQVLMLEAIKALKEIKVTLDRIEERITCLEFNMEVVVDRIL